MNPYRIATVLLVASVIAAACSPAAPTAPPATATVPRPTATPAPPTDTPLPPTDTPIPGPTPLPAEPQRIEFQAADGTNLVGLYYPAAVNPAPLVVLMHWVGGDMSDWYEIAPWLQNRGFPNPYPNPGTEPWWDPTWFPRVPEGTSYGVFIFTYRGCTPYQAGCPKWTPDVWLLDSQAAMLKARELEGVDPTKIAAIGASVGADGAIDACFWLNEQKPGSCQGALSLSPGSYMDIGYKTAVKKLGQEQPPKAAWCLADPSEIAICNDAVEAGNPSYRAVEIQHGNHGIFLLVPEADPSAMQTILDFLAEVLGP